MKFETNQPEVEFQTGHALWALQAARIPVTNPQVEKAIDYLMGRQQEFRRMDGSFAIVREFPDAVPRDADGGAGAEFLFSDRRAR